MRNLMHCSLSHTTGIKIEQDNALELFFITVILLSFFPLLAVAEIDNHYSIVLLHDSCGCRYDISAVISILSIENNRFVLIRRYQIIFLEFQ